MKKTIGPRIPYKSPGCLLCKSVNGPAHVEKAVPPKPMNFTPALVFPPAVHAPYSPFIPIAYSPPGLPEYSDPVMITTIGFQK